LNWQHCSDTVSFPSHSYEQYYQSIRRFYRFGQTSEVKVRIIVNEGEAGILQSLRRKAKQSDEMFESIVSHMNDALHLVKIEKFTEKERMPVWLS